MKQTLAHIRNFAARWFSPLLLFLALCAIMLGIGSAFGCASGTKKINHAASNSAALARQIETHADALRPMVVDIPEAGKHVEGIAQAARDIGVEADKIHAAIPLVKDVSPWWAQALENITWIILGCGVLFALFYFGLAAPIRAFLTFVGSFVPAILPGKVKAAAKLDAEALDSHPTPELDKTVTVRRASDPMYDAAWKALRREQAKKNKDSESKP